MKSWKALLVLGVLVCFLVCVTGCDDDNDDGSGPVTGELDDPAFEGIMMMTDNAAEMNLNVLATGMELIRHLNPLKAPQQGMGRWVNVSSYDHAYNAASGWHEFTVTAMVYESLEETKQIVADSMRVVGTDSIRMADSTGAFLAVPPNEGDPVAIELRSIFEIIDFDGPVIYDTAAFVMTGPFVENEFSLSGPSFGEFTEAADTQDECDMNGTFSMSFTNLVLSYDILWGLTDDCPSQGSMSMGMIFSYDCPDGVAPDSMALNGPLSASYTFGDGMMTVTATYNNTTWSYTDWCGPDPTALSTEDSLFVQEVFSSVLDVYRVDLPISEGLLAEWFSNSKAASSEVDSIRINNFSGHTYAGGWHSFDFNVTLFMDGDSIDILGVDSITIYENGVIVMQPADMDSLSGLDIRMHGEFSTSGGDQGQLHHQLDFRAVDEGGVKMAHAYGSIDDSVYIGFELSGGEPCRVEVINSQAVNFIYEPGNPACPTSGTTTITGSLDIGCLGMSEPYYNANGDWTVTAVANDGDGTLTIQFNNGHAIWSVTGPCGVVPIQ